MSTIQEKLKLNRTRPAEVMGEPVNVKVYSGKEWGKVAKKLDKFSDKKMAEFLTDQFTDNDGKKVFTAEFLLSDDCPNCVPVELIEIIGEVNLGIYKKKGLAGLTGLISAE